MLKEICVWLVGLVMMLFAFRYAYQIRKRDIFPTISTWIIILLGTGLSLATYAVAEKHDFRSGVLNTFDVFGASFVLIAIIVWGKRAVRFKPFEKWYLIGIGAIIAYGFLSGDVWRSNIFTQVLITIGYIPTIQTLLTEKKNTESFTGWGCGVLAGLLALYPAITGGNTLALLYVVRSTLLASCIIAIMVYLELRSKRSRP